MSRYKAASIHLVISICVFLLFLTLVFFVWYAYPFYRLEGVGEIVYIMAGVDVVLGPLLTLALFKMGKPGLKLDLFLIAFVQISALVYGTFIIYSERPVYAVFYEQQFEVVDKSDINFNKLSKDVEAVSVFEKPKYVFQSNSRSKFELLKESLEKKHSPRYATHYETYQNYAKNYLKVIENTRPASELELLKELPNIEKYRYSYLVGSVGSILVLLDHRTAEVKQYIDIPE